MEITQEKIGAITVLAVQGSLDASTSAALEQRLAALLDTGERRLLCDLAGLTYVSSAGLRVFVSASKKLKAQAGQLALCALSAQVQRVFDLAGFSAFLTIRPAREEALAALGA